MINLFYILGTLFFLFELGILQNPKKYLYRLRLLEGLNKESENGEKKIELEFLICNVGCSALPITLRLRIGI